MNNVLTLIGFARKSGNLIIGETQCELGVKTKKISLLIIASDMNHKTVERMTQLCNNEGVPYKVMMSKTELSSAIGKENVGLFGISNKKFSRALIEAIDAL